MQAPISGSSPRGKAAKTAAPAASSSSSVSAAAAAAAHHHGNNQRGFTITGGNPHHWHKVLPFSPQFTSHSCTAALASNTCIISLCLSLLGHHASSFPIDGNGHSDAAAQSARARASHGEYLCLDFCIIRLGYGLHISSVFCLLALTCAHAFFYKYTLQTLEAEQEARKQERRLKAAQQANMSEVRIHLEAEKRSRVGVVIEVDDFLSD